VRIITHISKVTFICSLFSQHKAAVKALAWCPWQPGVLASGGGTADRTIKLWNCNSGSLIKSVDAMSQVGEHVRERETSMTGRP